MTPCYTIYADGKEVTATIADRLVELRITDEDGWQADTLELLLDDAGHAIARPRKGVELRVSLGYKETGLYELGVFVVDEVEVSGPPRRLRVTARAVLSGQSTVLNALEYALKEPKSRSWVAKTLVQIVSQICTESGYTPRVSAALAGIMIPHVDQTAESDLHFLTRLALNYDAVVKPAATNLVLALRATGLSATGQFLSPIVCDFARGEWLDWRFTFPEQPRWGSVVAYWHDYAAAARIPEVAEEKEGSTPRKELPMTYPTAAEAKAAAWAEYARAQRAEATGSITLVGDPLLSAERPVEISNYRPEANGSWLVTRAEHILDSGGYRTRLELEVPGKTEVTA